MASPFKSVTTDRDEKAIDRIHGKFIDKGFSSESAVYRNPQDVLLAILALNSPDLPDLRGDFALSVNTAAKFCIVMARNGKDLAPLRQRVNDLRSQIYPSLIKG